MVNTIDNPDELYKLMQTFQILLLNPVVSFLIYVILSFFRPAYRLSNNTLSVCYHISVITVSKQYSVTPKIQTNWGCDCLDFDLLFVFAENIDITKSPQLAKR